MEWELLGIVLVGLYGIIGYIFRFPNALPYSPSSSKRDERLDQIRGIAMIGVVCIHIHSYFEYFHPIDFEVTTCTLFISNLSRFAVPVFIFGSSLFLKKGKHYWQNKIISLALPYFLACLFGYLIKYQNYSLSDFAIRFITGTVFAPYYFVPLLFQFYLLYFILPSRLFQGFGLISLVIVSFFINLFSNLGAFNNLFPNWYSPISIFNFLFFFSLGLYIRQLEFKDENVKKNIQLTLVSLVICATILIFFVSLTKINLKNHHLIYPLLIIFLLNSTLSETAKTFASRTLSFIGKNSLYIFLLHPFVIHQMHAFDPYTLINPLIGYIFTLIVNIGIPTWIAYLFTFRSGNVLNR